MLYSKSNLSDGSLATPEKTFLDAANLGQAAKQVICLLINIEPPDLYDEQHHLQKLHALLRTRTLLYKVQRPYYRTFKSNPPAVSYFRNVCTEILSSITMATRDITVTTFH